MGCCVSKGAQELLIDIPRTVSTTDEWTLRQKSFLDGCKLLPYTAACPASYPYQCLTRVVLGEGHLFAALWEGKGGSQAARHCISVCYDTLMELLKAGNEPSVALQKAFKQMDESYLASDLPDLVKAGVGATGTMLLLDTRSNRCHIARLGKAMPFATATKGSFNTVAVEVKDLLPFSNNARAKSSSSAGEASSSSSSPQQQDQQWDPATAGVTHAIGIGCGKRDDLRKVWQQRQLQRASGADAAGARRGKQPRVPRISAECEVYVSQLSTQDENLVIAAEGLIQVSPPKEIATLLQHFSAGSLMDSKRALCAIKEQQMEIRKQQEEADAAAGRVSSAGRSAKRKAAGASEAEVNPLAELSTPTNVASIVVHQAMAKSLDKFNAAFNTVPAGDQQLAAPGSRQGRKQDRQQPGAAYQVPDAPPELTYSELLHLPMNVDLGAFTAGKGQPVEVRLPDYYPVGGLSKADVHGDMGIIVIALNWPRPADAIGAAVTHVTPLRPGPRALTRRPDAEWRWMLLRLHVKARQAYKRSLRKAWWQLVVDVQVAAEAAARQAEVHAWKTKGAAVKVSLGGAVVGPDAPASHLRAHTTPTGPMRQPHRQPSASPASRPSSSSNQTFLTPSGAGSSGGALPRIHTAGSSIGGGGSYGGAYGSSSAGVEQEHSLPDVAARSLRSSGGVRGGVVAAAVAAINSRSPSDSPKSFAGSTTGAGFGRHGVLSGLHTECSSYGGQDTYQDLDSPTKGLDSPSRHEWVTPPGPKVAPSRIPGYGSQASAVGASNSSHKNLSLRGRGPAAKPASPAALSYTPDRAGAGRQGTPSGAYVAGAGVTGRRGTSGGGAPVSLRGGGSTPGGSRAEIGLRKSGGVRR